MKDVVCGDPTQQTSGTVSCAARGLLSSVRTVTRTLSRHVTAALAGVGVAGCVLLDGPNHDDQAEATPTLRERDSCGPDTLECEVGSVCAWGFCRKFCTLYAPGVCETQTCISSACRYRGEDDCLNGDVCPEGLACGLDGLCRIPCTSASDCPVEQTQCLAGVCVNEGEAGIDDTWFECEDGERRCDGNLLVGCNTTRLGLIEEAVCADAAACEAALASGEAC